MTSERRSGGTPPYEEAFEALGLSGDASPRDLKKAYRRAVAAHPPDRDAEGFRRVRAAYELLSAPEDALELLLQPQTAIPPPEIVPVPAVELAHALPLSALRALMAKVDAAALYGDLDER